MDFLTSFAPILLPLGLIAVGFFLFGERQLWELVVEFPPNPAYGEGTVRLFCRSRTGPYVVGFFTLTSTTARKPMEIDLKEQQLMSVPATRMKGHRLRLKDKVAIDKPNEGDLVVVRIGGQVAFSGQRRES